MKWENGEHVFFLTEGLWCLQDLQDLEKQLNELKKQAPPPATGGDGSVGDRLEKLQRDVGVLANTTDSILKSLGGSVTVLMLTTRV